MKKHVRILAVILGILTIAQTLLLSGCSKTGNTQKGTEPKEIAPPEVSAEFDQSVNTLAVKLTQAVADEGNGELRDFCVSPMSLYMALDLTSLILTEEGKAVLTDAFGGIQAQDCKEYARWMNETGQSVQWGVVLMPYAEAYQDRAFVKDFQEFGAAILSPDNGSVDEWLKQVGNQSLKYTPTGDAFMDMLNYTQFTSEWENPFSLDVVGTFTRENGTETEVQYMRNGSLPCRYRMAEKYYRVSIPLKIGKAFFILPKAGLKIADVPLEEALTEDGKDRYTAIDVKLPKFEYQNEIELDSILKKMGLGKLFQDGMVNVDGCEETVLGKIRQECRFEADEHGVRAEALTVVPAFTTAALPAEHLTLDRPFLYGICDNDGRILFTGVCAMAESEE